MGQKSKKEKNVYIWLVYFVVTAETDTAVQSNYIPIKKTKTNDKTHTSKTKPKLSRKSQGDPEYVQLLLVVDEWVLNPRAAVRGRMSGPEQASEGITISLRHPLATDLNFLFPCATIYLAFSGSLIHSHLGG